MSAAKSELESEVETLRAQVDQLTQALERTLREKRLIEERMARWLRRYFGPKAERIDPRQMQIDFGELADIGEALVEPPPVEHAREAADFFAGAGPSEIYTSGVVGSVRCV